MCNRPQTARFTCSISFQPPAASISWVQPTRAPQPRHWCIPPPSPMSHVTARRRARSATCFGVGPDPMNPSRSLQRSHDTPLRFSKHFAQEAAPRRTTNERRRAFPTSPWPKQPAIITSERSVFADYRSYGEQHPAHRVRQPGSRRIVSQDCLCPSSAFRRPRPPPSAFKITAPGYDCRYQVLAVLATEGNRPNSPDYPWPQRETQQRLVSDSKCAKWILKNL